MYAKRTLLFQGILCFMVALGVFFAGTLPAKAQGLSITYVGQTVTCSSITITYTISGATTPPGSVLVEAIVNDSPLSNTDGPATDGNHTLTLNFPTQPTGSTVYGRVSDGFSTVQGSLEACGAGGSTPTVPPPTATVPGPTSIPPTNTPPPSSVPGSTSIPPTNTPPPSSDDSSLWGGYSDGRQNPDPAEYYSIWCNFDRIDVYRSSPETELLKLIPLTDVIALSIGGVLDLGNFMTLVRNGEDTATIYGSNGNLAPEPGQKSFSLAACIASNGGPPSDPPPSNDDNSSSSDFDYSLCSDPEFFETFSEECLEDFLNVGAGLWVLCISQFVAPFGLVFGGYFVLRRRRKR